MPITTSLRAQIEMLFIGNQLTDVRVPQSRTPMFLRAVTMALSAVILSCGTGGAVGDGGTGDTGVLPNSPFCDRIAAAPWVAITGTVTLCRWDQPEGARCMIGMSPPLDPGGCYALDSYDPSFRDYVRNNRVPKLCGPPPHPTVATARCFRSRLVGADSPVCGLGISIDGTTCRQDLFPPWGLCVPAPCN